MSICITTSQRPGRIGDWRGDRGYANQHCEHDKRCDLHGISLGPEYIALVEAGLQTRLEGSYRISIGACGAMPTYLARGRISWPVAYCSMAWPIQPMVRPIANDRQRRARRQPEHARQRRRARSRHSAARASAAAAASATSMTNASSATSRIARAACRAARSPADRRAVERMPEAVDRLAAPQPRRRPRVADARDRRSESSIASMRALMPPCLVPSSAASPAITTAYGCDPADATQRAVNDETFSS